MVAEAKATKQRKDEGSKFSPSGLVACDNFFSFLPMQPERSKVLRIKGFDAF